MDNTGCVDSVVQGSAWKRKLREEQEWEGEDYGPVTWEELSNMRRNSVILFNSELYPSKISEWSLRAEPGRDSKYYICVLCRRLQDRGKRLIPPMKFGPPARIIVRNGRFLTHPDHPRTPHICGFADNPMSDRAAVLARRAIIRARTEISEDGMTPREKISQILASFREDEKYAILSAEEVEQMEDMVLGRAQGHIWSESSIVRSLYISRRKLIAVGQNDKPRKVYECPVVGCDFLTSAPGMIDVHVSEKHRSLDDPGVAEPADLEEEYVIIREGDGEAASSSLSDAVQMQSATTSASTTSQIGMEQQNTVCEPEGDYGPVLYEALSCQRRKSIILFESKRFPNKISEWALKMPTNDMTMYYTCVLCRKLKDKGKRQEPPVQYPPPARIVVRNGRFMVHPDYPRTPHICDFENNPLSDRQSVLSRRTLAKKPVNGPVCGFSVRKSLNRINHQDAGYRYVTIVPQDRPSSSTYVVEEPSTWPQDPEESLSDDDSDGEYGALLSDAGHTVDAATAATSVMPSTSAYFESDREKACQIYNCTIVGCNFTTSTATDLEVHLHEHELLDEQVEQYELFEESEPPYENDESVEIIDEVSVSEPFRKRRKLMSSEDHLVLAEVDEVECKEDAFEKSDLPTDVPPSEGDRRSAEDLRSSIRTHLQNLERSIQDLGTVELLEIDGYLTRIGQRLCDIHSANMLHFQKGDSLSSTVSTRNADDSTA